MAQAPVIIVGAGIGGLAAAISLAARGVPVRVMEKEGHPGGKMRQLRVGGRELDAGPTVFTMRWIFDALFEEAGEELSHWLSLARAEILARHAWDGVEETFDLYADADRTEAAVAAFAGNDELHRFRAFRAEARELFEAMNPRFIEAQQAGIIGMTRRFPPSLIAKLLGMNPSATLWSRLGRYFHDPRLRQLYARYATYCGSSPFQAPGLLALVAHVEQEGVWLVGGGMHGLARALVSLGETLGVEYHFDTEVSEISVRNDRVEGVVTAGSGFQKASAVIFNGDVSAIAAGYLGGAARGAVDPVPASARSLSALVWSMVARTDGLPLSRHTVFFAKTYQPEFDAIFREGRLPETPTVYVCAQDRDANDGPRPKGSERLHIHINAPANGDMRPLTRQEIDQCTEQSIALMSRAGLRLLHDPAVTQITTPTDFEKLFPATGGALYGRANHGPMASFRRMGSRTRLPGLYLAGGSVHPGPGVPMAAMSGRLAAARLLADLSIEAPARGSTSQSRRAAISGGISMG
ncbi:MAG: 1-hydroxycarotenoid 3,4-desaturase CrtD [Pseudomonadota bacterium]